MPILPPSYLSPYNTTASIVVDSVADDLLQGIGAESPSLLDYVNRISLEMLRHCRWAFLESPMMYFITQREQTDYWIGPQGYGPNTAVDTALNLYNFGLVKENTVYDYSNYRLLQRVANPPVYNRLGFPDTLSRPGKPAVYRMDPYTPNILSVYPAPDNQNNYVPEPPSPIVTNTLGGSLALRTYWVLVTYVDSYGFESTPSDTPTLVVIPANYLAVVQPPKVGIEVDTRGVAYNQYNIYAQSAGTFTSPPDTAPPSTNAFVLQNTSPVGIGVSWTEPTSGLLTVGNNPPTTNNLTPLDGYIISFKYYQSRVQVTSLSQVLQIPDYYKDVVIAGVNWLAAKFLERNEPMQFWGAVYKDGLRQMIKDKNLFPRGSQDYVGPDGATLRPRLPSIETVELANQILM